jgi:hypothetical protein
MNEQELYEYLLNTLQPRYEKAFGVERKKNIMNISSLVSGAPSYLYHWKERASEPKGKINLALLRGSAIHAYINQKLEDFDRHALKWSLPYEWKSGEKDILILGHYDNIIPIENTNVLCEWKTTAQEDPKKNGLLIRAKRQIAAYAQILRFKTGIENECFVVIINQEVTIFKLTPDEIKEGYEFVRQTAYAVARILDVEIAK